MTDPTCEISKNFDSRNNIHVAKLSENLGELTLFRGLAIFKRKDMEYMTGRHNPRLFVLCILAQSLVKPTKLSSIICKLMYTLHCNTVTNLNGRHISKQCLMNVVCLKERIWNIYNKETIHVFSGLCTA